MNNINKNTSGIKLLILDVDGIMTDGKKYYNENGDVVLKIFCDKDWTAIKRFRSIGIPVVFITGDSYNENILKNRNLPVIVNRGTGYHNDKVNYLADILEDYDCFAEEVLYLGDDLFDIGIMKAVGHPYCLLDSPRIVKQTASILQCKAGENVIMQLFDKLEIDGLIPIVKYAEVIRKIYDLDLKEKF
jgi:3-deoxy-D-manno-octulosonate 8-phosphate phosphatase (KDO 8-P phosphatase)